MTQLLLNNEQAMTLSTPAISGEDDSSVAVKIEFSKAKPQVRIIGIDNGITFIIAYIIFYHSGLYRERSQKDEVIFCCYQRKISRR